MSDYPSWIAAIETARWEALAQLKEGFARDNWRGADAFTPQDPSVQLEGVIERAQRNLVSKRAVVANLNRAFADAIAIQQKPFAPMISGRFDEGGQYDLISEQFVPRANLRFNQAREQTHLDLLLLRLALQTYRAEKGVYPPNLAALQNGILKRIPTDDFGGGNPYFYTLKNGKYRLWSVGPDATNDGGKAIPERSPTRGNLPWMKTLPSTLPDSQGDVVAGETR